MADIPGGKVGALNGTTWVAVVPAPAAGVQRVVDKLLAFNADSAAHSVKWRKVKGGSNYQLGGNTAVPISGQWLPIVTAQKVVLGDSDESLEMQTDVGITAVNVDAAWLDCSDDPVEGAALSKGVLGILSNVVAGETVTIGADVFEAVNVGTDSGKFTSLNEWNNTNPVITATITAHGLLAGSFIGLGSGELFKIISVVDADHVLLMCARGGTPRSAYGNGGPIYKQNNAVTSGRIPWPYNGAAATPTPAIMRPSLVCEINNALASGERCAAQASTIFATVQGIVIAYPSTDIRVEATAAGIAYALAETMAGSGNLWTAAAMA